jgi:hypothetical protein
MISVKVMKKDKSGLNLPITHQTYELADCERDFVTKVMEDYNPDEYMITVSYGKESERGQIWTRISAMFDTIHLANGNTSYTETIIGKA